MSNDIRFVRVQDDLYGMEADAQGNIVLKYKRDTERNTIHFSVNSIVEDHTYGKFNYDQEGNLKGNVVIIANPSDMITPAALNQVDTWFRWGIKNNERSLNIGKAIIVVKEGIKVPEGINALFFDGTIEDRDRIVKEHFESLNIPMERCGWWSWNGYDMDTSHKWAQETKQKLYGNDAKNIYSGPHSSSLDHDLELASVKGFLESFKKNNVRFYLDEYDVSYISTIKNHAERSINFIEKFLDDLNDSERKRIGSHYEFLAESIKKDVKEAEELDLKLTKEHEINYLNQLIEEFPGIGDFHIVNSQTRATMQINPKDLQKKLINCSLSGNDYIWRSGFKADWVTIDKTIFYESMVEIKKLLESEKNQSIALSKDDALDRMNLITTNLRNPNIETLQIKPK